MKSGILFMLFFSLVFMGYTAFSQKGQDKKTGGDGVGMNKSENRVTIKTEMDDAQKGVQVDTKSVDEIIRDAAVCKYTVKLKDPAVFKEQGICWGKTSGPMVTGTKAAVSTYTESVVIGEMTGLESGTKYFVRAYLTTTSGTVYGKELTFTTLTGQGVSTYWIRRR
jgi:hypothetical protein